MNSTKLGLLLILPGFMLTGCSSMSNTDAGILGGGAIGAATGAIVGKALGNTGAGALIGAGAGAVTGGLIGNAEDKKEVRDARIAAVNARNMGMTDVAQMTRNGISDGVIIEQIRTSGVVYNLSSADVIWLKEQHVSDQVVFEMQQTALRYPRYYRQPAYVVEPPPVAVGVGFGYGRGW
ncbi:MAG TPA: glycine zipper domain-containing protein [Gemmataceae bacterium]|nr:glycine zipper domain-containing protein [Gemmataceae bacterium]